MNEEIGFTHIIERLDGHTAWLRDIASDQIRIRQNLEYIRENMVTRKEFRSAMDRIMGRFDELSREFNEFASGLETKLS